MAQSGGKPHFVPGIIRVGVNEDQQDTGQYDSFNIHASTESLAEPAMDEALYNFIGGADLKIFLLYMAISTIYAFLEGGLNNVSYYYLAYYTLVLLHHLICNV